MNAVTPLRPVPARRSNVIELARFVRWRRTLEDARTAFGMRAATMHISDADWSAHFTEGGNPVDAVLVENRED